MRSGVICGVLLATVASAAGKQPEPSPEGEVRQTFVGLVPISLSQGLLAIDGEQVLNPKLSVRLGVRFGGSFSKRGKDDLTGDSSNLLMGVEPGIRYYLMGSALDGLWWEPHVEGAYQRQTTKSRLIENGIMIGMVTNRVQGWTAGVATLLGYSAVVARGLTIQGGVGFGVNYTFSQMGVEPPAGSVGVQTGLPDNHTWTLSPRATLAVGWSF